jgi:hypothetical protein
VYLGDFPFKRFVEKDVQTYISEFKAQLDDLTEEIKERNKQLDVPYTYMLPTEIPNSITI